MANAAFDDDATALSGGVDGTIASGMKIMVDETYMYVCLDGNTTAIRIGAELLLVRLIDLLDQYLK